MPAYTLPDRHRSALDLPTRLAVVLLAAAIAANCGGRATEPDPDVDARLHLRDIEPLGTLDGSLGTTITSGARYLPPAPFRKRLDVKAGRGFVKWLTFDTDDDLTPKDVFGGSFMSKPLQEQRIEAGFWHLRVSGDRVQVGDEVDLHASLFTAFDAGGGRYERRETIAEFRAPTGYNFCYGNTSSRILAIPGAAVDVRSRDVLVLELWAVLANRSFGHGAGSILRLYYDGATNGATESSGGCGTGSLNNDSRLDPPRPVRFEN
jgi:hypothetical protein